MKIAFILILHLGLVACGNDAANASPTCNKCNAIKKIDNYFFDVKDNAKGTKFAALLEEIFQEGVITSPQKVKLIGKISETYKEYGNLQVLVMNAKSIIEDKFCNCNGVPAKVCKSPLLPFQNTSTIFDDLPDALNSSAGPVVVDEKEHICLLCWAIDELEKYIRSKKDDQDGTIFWALINKITGEGVLTAKETDRLKIILPLEHVVSCSGQNYNTGADQVIKYIHQISTVRCCKWIGPSKLSCTMGIPNLEKAILLIKEFIDRNYQCPEELSIMLINFYVQESITLQQWKVYDKMMKDQLKDIPEKVAEFVLKDLNFNNGIKKLEDYESEVRKDPKNDPQGTKIFELMRKFKDEELMSQGQYDQGLVSWKGNKINRVPLRMVEYVRQMLIANHGYLPE